MRNLLLIFSFTIAYTPSFGQSDFYTKLAHAALRLTENKVTYDPTYYSIPYPNGDVPLGKGVCTDVIIRAYRAMEIDLQQKVHEDMRSNFSVYPKKWGRKSPDKNIDHRRVLNLMKYFERRNASRKISSDACDYLPGDIVSWELPGGLTHIGIVSSRRNSANSRYLIVHNIGAGQVLEDFLFVTKIIGHYRWKG